MQNLEEHKTELDTNGYSIIDLIYSKEEVTSIIELINQLDTSKPIFRKTENIFAIRQFLKEVPEIKPLIFNENLKNVIKKIGGKDYFVVKSIYFDKPEKSNWFVSYHQDLTISVDKKLDNIGFSNWTTKHNQFAVQPTSDILENIFTVRIHLDDTNDENGALKILEKSHQKSVFRLENLNLKNEKEFFCNVKSGGIMLMKPLLFHGSNKTTNEKNRRVIHIEFSNKILPNNLIWSEFKKVI